MQNARNITMMGKKRLPYDAEVEYLESTGTQYIDTGVLANGEFDFDYMFRLNTLQGNTIGMGARSASQCLTALQINSSQRFVFAYLDTVWAQSVWEVTNNKDYRVQLHFHDGSQSATVNDAVLFTYKRIGTEALNLPIYIFKRSNSATETTYGLSGRFYFCKIWQNGILVRDLIPVRVGTVGYLYDRVSGKLFGNAGTGDFLYGADVHAVEWLEGDGSAYIVLPQSITSSKTTALSIECKYIADVSAINKCVFASYYGSRWYAIGRIQYNAAPVIIARFGNTGQYMRTTDLNGVYTTKIIPSQDKVIENGVEYSATFTAGLNQAVDAIGLFCAYNTNDKSIQAVNSSRLYWFNVLSVDGGSIVKNLIPIRVGNEGAMMDTLTRRIYRNAGSGAFGYGNDLKYPIPSE